MHLRIPFYLTTCAMVFVMLSFGQNSESVNLTPTGPKNKSCKTSTNEDGFCVHNSICSNAHEIISGGRVLVGELRISSDCNKDAGEWCCTMNRVVVPTVTTAPVVTVPPVTPVPPVVPSPPVVTVPPAVISSSTVTAPPVVISTPTYQARSCIVVTDKKECPWFVKLYRTGESSPYCLGAMIGSKVILTTATCELQAQNRFLWATVPSSAHPEANYTVLTRLRHPNYNSGTRLNDIALLSLVSNIDWGSDGPKGACIDPKQTLGGDCTAANLNVYDDLVKMVSLFVTPGACTAGGNVADAMCGNGLFGDPLPHGTPIMCRKNNMFILAGVTKRSYDSSRALLGKLDYDWLMNNLKGTMGLNDRDFLYSLNYN